ncbi:hypothetical protein AK812_SmicGene35270 [Symbiodinium microadriaticum]|uniref:Uncharacterized protein n=1 Tax=Symbiodinium microadriaticum TaxID=2951 RepID=A0A1Q9CLX1_SYMMI|nr:hypothetical protein AK812_SmicGene35270 [Symbiodinium microadriaticum]
MVPRERGVAEKPTDQGTAEELAAVTQRLEGIRLPSSLQSLTFGYVPGNLQRLTFGYVFNWSLEGIQLSSSLQSWTFGYALQAPWYLVAAALQSDTLLFLRATSAMALKDARRNPGDGTTKF